MLPKKEAMVEGYAGNFERYRSVAEKKKHEKTESKADLAKESKRERLIAKKRKGK